MGNKHYIDCFPVSRIACSLHLINSVGHNVNEEKNAAKNPTKKCPI